MKSFGRFASTSQAYLYGNTRCTKSGWDFAIRSYDYPDILAGECNELFQKVYLITDADEGIGREISTFLASKGAIVYMVCRSEDKALMVRKSIIESTHYGTSPIAATYVPDYSFNSSPNFNVHILIGDCGLEADVRRVFQEFVEHRSSHHWDENDVEEDTNDSSNWNLKVSLDGLVCHIETRDECYERLMTVEDIETVFATHLLFGSYLLGELALPILATTPGSRVIVIAGDSMYNTKFPAWEEATSTSLKPYDYQLSLSYAQRGQVLLCERWASQYSSHVKVVSCHPGWVQTKPTFGNDLSKSMSDISNKKKQSDSLRTTWQGAEGILWLCIAPLNAIQDGGFYLDRSPQPKHIAGPFFTEGTYTKNTTQEIDEMMIKLELWSRGIRPSLVESMQKIARSLPLQPITTTKLDMYRLLGTWYVLASIPSYFEIGCFNYTVNYVDYSSTTNNVNMSFEYFPKNSPKNLSKILMRGEIKNPEFNSHWVNDIKKYGIIIPININYLIIDIDPVDYAYVMIALPDRSAMWIMTRARPAAFDSKETSSSITNVYDLSINPSSHRTRLSSQATSATNKQSSSPSLVSNVNNNSSIMSSTSISPKTKYQPSTPNSKQKINQSLKNGNEFVTINNVNEEEDSDGWQQFGNYLTSIDLNGQPSNEVSILEKTLSKAMVLGFDMSEVVRMNWRSV
eukprot:gene13673-18348_t